MEQFTMERNGSQMTVHISQELDHHIAAQVSRMVDMQIEKGSIRTLVFDFSGITFMDSSGIGMVAYTVLYRNIRKGQSRYDGKDRNYI